MSTHIILNKNVKRGRIILDVEEMMLSEVDHALTEILSIGFVFKSFFKAYNGFCRTRNSFPRNSRNVFFLKLKMDIFCVL